MHHKITLALVFIFFAFLQVGKCHETVATNNVLKSDVELAMAREYERVALFDDLIPDQEDYNDATSEEKNVIDFMKNSKKELLKYYDELKKESLSKNVIPNMDNHLFEVEFLECLRKYVTTYVEATIKKLHKTSLKKPEIEKIEDHLKYLKKIIIDQAIIPLQDEIKNHPDEWKILDLFYNLISGQTVDQDQETPEVIKAYSRYENILRYAIKNNLDFLREFYEDLKKCENELVEDLDDVYSLLTTNEWVESDEPESYEW